MLTSNGKGVSGNSQPTCKKIQNYIFNFSQLLGQGNFSKVYKAKNQITNEIVAIKIIELNSLKSKKLEELLFSQIDILKKLKHPNILKCHQVFTSNRNCYIITEFCNGGDLDSHLKKKGYYRENDIQPIIKDVFQGLIYLSQHNIVHRDLKVTNIFLHNKQAKIADFGFAKHTMIDFKDINIGSPIYMSPQGLINNIYGHKTDVWAFGILIYELLHGETPFSHCKTEKQLRQAISMPFNRNKLKSELSNQIKQVIINCLQIVPQLRISIHGLKNLGYFRRIISQSTLTQFYSSLDHKFMHYSDGNIHSYSEQPKINYSYLDTYKRQNNLMIDNDKEKLRAFTPINPNRTEQPWLKKQESKYDSKRGNSVDRGIFNENQFKNKTIDQISSVQLSSKYGNSIISGILTFKSCVNLLHYCRLLYKHIILVKNTIFYQASQSNVFTRWLAIILKTINDKINRKEIICGGDNGPMREEKLRQVVSQYIKKYTLQLGVQIDRFKVQENTMATFQSMTTYFQTVFQQIDGKLMKKQQINTIAYQVGHSIIIVCLSTKFLKKCYDLRDYTQLQNYKQIQQFLRKKYDMNYNTYSQNRNKIYL